MRNAFAQTLTNIAEIDERVMLLCGDIGNKLFDSFKAIAPNRLYNCGIAEANMTGMSAGLAMMGFRPFTYSITPFVTVRCLEQIRVDICYHNLPVTIVGTGAGLSYAELGPTHHSCDDVGFLRMLPNLTIICPCDAIETELAVLAALKQNGPVYIRLGKKGEPRIHQTAPDFKIGKSLTIRAGSDLCILSMGNMMPVALQVTDILTTQGISTRVESFHTIKPLDTEFLNTVVKQYKTLVTIEEHSVMNGLGSAIAEWCAQYAPAIQVVKFGTSDKFLPCIGSQNYARDYFGLTADKIANQLLTS